jgi:pimeloyl-ACP methyl ester carboxylesterase
MHPIGGTAGLPVMRLFAEAGVHILAADSRYRGVDNALIMEKVALDLGAAVRHAREKLGYAKVILLGWSGGGALSAFYQAEAEQPSLTHTPAGDPLSLVDARLVPADGIILMAAHVSRHGTLTEWLDPSILDESDPTRRDPELDLYDPDNPNQPPYPPEFIERYRQAQIDRNRRITAWVKAQLAELKSQGRSDEELCFVVHGTMADPRWLDPAVDPNDREPGTCYLGDPRVVNNSPVGLARFCSLRSCI